MSGSTKKVFASLACVLLIAGSLPILTSVSGQAPRSDLEWEVFHLQEEMKDLKAMPIEIAILQQQVKLEDARYQEQRDFEAKLMWGFLGTAGGILLALFGWVMHNFGITLPATAEKRRSA